MSFSTLELSTLGQGKESTSKLPAIQTLLSSQRLRRIGGSAYARYSVRSRVQDVEVALLTLKQLELSHKHKIACLAVGLLGHFTLVASSAIHVAKCRVAHHDNASLPVISRSEYQFKVPMTFELLHQAVGANQRGDGGWVDALLAMH